MKMQRWLGLLLLGGLLSSGAVGYAKAEDAAIDDSWRIIGGEEATGNSWPWQIALFQRAVGEDGQLSKDEFFPTCGGSLISEHWVLTAAHCFGAMKENHLTTSDYLVLEGTKQLCGSCGRPLRVKQIIVHQRYQDRGDNSATNDIALIELANPATSIPVALARPESASTLEQPGKAAMVTGFGRVRSIVPKIDPNTHKVVKDASGHDVQVFADNPTEEVNASNYASSMPPGGKLRQVELRLVGWQQCRDANRLDWLSADQICAGVPEGGKDSCQGDSGGPLVVRDETGTGGWIQVGVVSTGFGCGVPGRPGIYTRVSAYADWLKQYTGIDQNKPSNETQHVVGQAFEQKNPAGLSVAFVEGGTLKLGQSVQFQVSTREAGYLVLLDVHPDGSVMQIYPNEASLRTLRGRRPEANLIRPNTDVLIPNPKNPYEGFRLVVQPPLGEGLIMAVLTDKPIKWLKSPSQPRAFSARADALSFIGEFAAASSRDAAAPGPDRPNYSVFITAYTVVQ